MTDQRKPLDSTDRKILRVLEGYADMMSSEELSTLLDGMPLRTVNHRLQMLRENSYIRGAVTQTHERKLGLGEMIVLLSPSISAPNDHLKKVLSSIPMFYYVTHTSGRINGFLAQALFTLAGPNSTRLLVDEMKRLGLISEHVVFENVDYHPLVQTAPTGGKKELGNWDDWFRDVEKSLNRNRAPTVAFDLNPALIPFDWTDIDILGNITPEADMTLRDLSKRIGLSETKTQSRVKRLEGEGIIRRRRWYVDMGEPNVRIYLFIETSRPMDPVLTCFAEMPVSLDIVAESHTRFCLRASVPAQDLTRFLRAIDILRPHLRSCFIQFIHDFVRMEADLVRRIYSRDTGRWVVPVDECLDKVRKAAKETGLDKGGHT